MSRKKLKLIIDGEPLVVDHFSGVGHYTADLFLALDRLVAGRSDVELEIFANYRRIDRLNRFDFKNTRFRRMPFPTRASNYLKIKGWQPPIDLIFGKRIYLYTNYSSWPALFSKSVPFIYDLSFVKYPQFVEPRNQAFLVEQVKKSAKRSSKIITISENSRQEIAEEYGTDPGDIAIAYPAIDQRKFYRRSNSEIADAKSKYKIVGDYILFVGNIEPRKNLKGLILAYEQLAKDVRDKYPLLLIGARGWLDDEIHQMITKSRRQGNQIIRPSKYVSDADLPALYSGASALAYVSLYEGFGIPPLEAMACGVPVVASNNSSLPEAVGEAGVMVDANDTKDVASGLNKVLTDKKLAERLRQEGYKQVDKFSYEKSAEILLKTLEDLA